MNPELIKTIRAMDRMALHYQVEIRARDMVELAQNTINPIDMLEMVERINETLPTQQYGPGNPNNGRMSHSFRFGREYSRVLYVYVIKTYHSTDFDYDALVEQFNEIGKDFLADEMNVTENEPSSLIFRYWWD